MPLTHHAGACAIAGLTLFNAAGLAASGLVAPAPADARARVIDQVADDPRQIMERSADALQQLESITGEMEAGGEAGGLLQFTSAKAQFVALRDVPPSERLTPMRMRLTGSGLTTRDRENPVEFDVVYSGSTAVWLDSKGRALRSRDYRTALRQSFTEIEVSSALIINGIFEARPLRQMIVQRATEPKLLESQTIDGVECFVIQYEFADGSNTNTFYIGKEDYLPRRIERATRATGGGIDFSSDEFFVMRNLRPGASVPQTRMAMAAPEGWADETTAQEPERPVRDPRMDLEDPKTRIPTFTLRSTSGEQVSTANFRGDMTLIYVFGTWLRPSTRIAPEIESLRKEYEGKGLRVVGVTFREPNEDAPKKFAEENGLGFDILLEGDTLVRGLSIAQYPAVVLVDGDGFIVSTHVGSSSAERVANDIKTAMAGAEGGE